jgi:hypothetical protein
MFQMAADGVGYTQIADYLTERGFPSGGSAAVWQSNRIRRILENRVYLGEARYGEIVKKGAHPALVSPDVWALAQREQTHHARRSAVTLLAGLVRCDCCRYAMRGSMGSKHVNTYECRPNARPGERCARPVAVSMRRLDEYVLKEFLARAEGVVLEQVADADDAAAAVVAAQDAYDDMRARSVEMIAALGAADYAEIISDLKADLDAKLTALPTPRPAATSDLATLFEEMRAAEDIVGLRELLGSVIQAVLVRPAVNRSNRAPISDRVEIVWQGEEEILLPKRGQRGLEVA